MWVIGIVVLLVVMIVIDSNRKSKDRAKPLHSSQKAPEYTTCPVCGKILRANVLYCSECGVDLRPVSSYMHLEYPKKAERLLALSFLSFVFFFIFFFASMFIYLAYEYNPFALFTAIFLCVLCFVCGIVFRYFSDHIKDRTDDEYVLSCKIEEQRRSAVIRNMIAEREEKAMAVLEEKRAKLDHLLEEQRLLEQKKADLIQKHEEDVKNKKSQIQSLHDKLPRYFITTSIPNFSSSPAKNIIIDSFNDDTPITALTDYVVIDIETSGFSPRPVGADGIAQIAAVRFKNFIPESVFITKTNPGISMPDDASKINGLYDHMLVDAPKAEHVMESFMSFIGDSTVVGFKLEFDLRFLTAYGYRNLSDSRKYIDINSACSRYLNFSGKLEEIGENVGFYCTYHREAYDALAIGYLLSLCIREKFQFTEEEFPGLYEWN